MAIHDGPASDVRTDPARPGFASTRIWVTDATPARIARARDPLALPHTHRAAAARIGLPDRHHPAGRHVPRQGRRERGRGILSRHRFTGCIDLLGRSTAPLYAENAHARFLPDPAKARSRWCSTPPRCRLRPVTPWCNGGPTTPGAIDRTDIAPSRSHRTTRRIETRPHAARSPARRGTLKASDQPSREYRPRSIRSAPCRARRARAASVACRRAPRPRIDRGLRSRRRRRSKVTPPLVLRSPSPWQFEQ